MQYTALIACKGMKMMTTMLEVAKRAGVSKATVSRVLSGNGYVSQETKDRVFQAVEESGYRQTCWRAICRRRVLRRWGW